MYGMVEKGMFEGFKGSGAGIMKGSCIKVIIIKPLTPTACIKTQNEQ